MKSKPSKHEQAPASKCLKYYSCRLYSQGSHQLPTDRLPSKREPREALEQLLHVRNRKR